jgi:hypothetical protein
MHTLFLIWQHSQYDFLTPILIYLSLLFISNSYYHQKDKFSQLLEVLSTEIATRAKQIITTDISSESNNVC